MDVWIVFTPILKILLYLAGLAVVGTKLFDLQKEYKLLIKQGPYNDNIYNIVDYSSDSSSSSEEPESSSINDNVTIV